MHDFALSLHVLLNKNYLFSLLNVQASAKSRQCKRTLKDLLGQCLKESLKNLLEAASTTLCARTIWHQWNVNFFPSLIQSQNKLERFLWEVFKAGLILHYQGASIIKLFYDRNYFSIVIS